MNGMKFSASAGVISSDIMDMVVDETHTPSYDEAKNSVGGEANMNSSKAILLKSKMEELNLDLTDYNEITQSLWDTLWSYKGRENFTSKDIEKNLKGLKGFSKELLDYIMDES